MKYKWESVGDQDRCIRKVCYLGPYLLEHVEGTWEYAGTDKHGKRIEELMMDSYIYLWNDKDKLPDRIAELPRVKYISDKSYQILEDWYATNVLFDELFTGATNERNKVST